MTVRLTTVIIANVTMGLLLYLSSQLVLSVLNGETLSGFNIFSFTYTVTFPPNSTIAVAPTPVPNFPFYVFVAFIVVNAYFIIKLQRDKGTKQNLSYNNA